MYLRKWERRGEDYILTFSCRTRLGRRTTKKYIGNGTVWHTFPAFHRCSTRTEEWLSDVWEKIRYEESSESHQSDRGRVVDINRLLGEIGAEVLRADNLHKPINSHHEGYAVILEELDEYWEQVRLKSEKRDPLTMRTELIQTAAMCIRTIRNVIDETVGDE